MRVRPDRLCLYQAKPNLNPGTSPHAANGHPAPAGFTADDAIFTLFRHKWLILAFVCLGVAGAMAVRVVKPPLYVSKAKLMVQYVLNTRDMPTANPEASHAQSLDVGAQSIINAEIEILTSLDVATNAADTIGPDKIFAKKGGGTNRIAAAGVICSGIEVDPPKSSILTISFKHPDADIVQPVLEAVLRAYQLKHREVRSMPDGYLLQQRDEVRKKLTKIEDDLRSLKIQSKIPFPEDANHAIQQQLAKRQDELLDAQSELLERQVLAGGTAHATKAQTNAVATSIPADRLSNYTFAARRLEELKQRLNELLLDYTEAYPLVQNVRDRIKKLTEQKAELERQDPGLAHLLVNGGQAGTNTLPTDVLEARVGALSTVISNLQGKASEVMDVQPKIAEMERLRLEQQRTYDSLCARLDQQQRDESMVAGKVINMSQVQSPTPPGLDYKKLIKLVGVVLAGCIGMGLGLAFLIDLYVDRSIKRSSDIERHLRLPVFLSIPDTSWGGWFHLPSWLAGRRRGNGAVPSGHGGNGAASSTTALAPWDPANQLLNYTEGLRERIISYFEVQNLNLKKPKLVGVTGCAGGAGVSTLASGLAAALSKTGEGNVLLVDMNVDQGVAHSFYKGKPGCGISDALEP